jgi:RHS repeat-associated protein
LRFSHGDHLGSTNLVTDSAGAVIEVSENTPYGTLYAHQGAATSPQQFTGQRLDPSTGLHFYSARYYDSQLGRFISPDPFVQAPADPQTLNRYSYVRNNPVKYIDPSGYFSLKRFFRALVHGVVAAAAVIVGIVALSVGAEPVAAAAFAVAARETVAYTRGMIAAFQQNSESSAGIVQANMAALSAEPKPGPSRPLLGSRSPLGTFGEAANNVLTPAYNTLTRPGWNYGEYLADLDAGRGVLNPHLFGAMLDSLLVISSVYYTFQQAVIYGPQRDPFVRYTGPESDPAGTWVTRASSSYGTDYAEAMDRLSSRIPWDNVKRVSVPWDQYVAGPRLAAPQFSRRGFGLEYRVGGFGNWKSYLRSWWDYWKNQLFANR